MAARLIAEFHDAMKRAEESTARFMIERGQALLVDNKRHLCARSPCRPSSSLRRPLKPIDSGGGCGRHARGSFTGDRRVWRVWWWSDRCTAEQLAFAEAELARVAG